jgi:hypothetical protein
MKKTPDVQEKYVPADSSTYLEGALPQYQSGEDWDLGDGEDPVDLSSLSNLMDPS